MGFSLGVDLIPRKYCSFDCIYCQLGKAGKTEIERQSFYDPPSVVGQVVQAVREGREIDCISLSGSGEPTLNGDIGRVIGMLKEKVSLPVAVITNGSLLYQPEVRRDLLRADIVLPSLDAASVAVYQKVNRPHPSLELPDLVEGLGAFRREYRGKIWLEVMLIDNINNDMQHLAMIKKIIDDIAVDRVQLNTVVRPPAEKTVRPVKGTELLSIARFLGDRCEVIAGGFEKQAIPTDHQHWQESLVAMLQRRSLSLKDVMRSTGASAYRARAGLERLIKEKKARAETLGGRRFYVAVEEEGSKEGGS